MLNAPLPDLAAGMALRRNAAGVRLQIERAASELATGQRGDLVRASGGDPARLFAIERARTMAMRDAEGLALAESRISASQSALGKLQELTGAIGVPLMAALGRGDLGMAKVLSAEAEDAFRLAALTVNERFAGRSLFAGAAVDGPAIISADEMLTELRAVLAAAPDANAAIADLHAWFDAPGGGFETAAWLGDPLDAPRVGLGDGQTEVLAPRGDAAEFRAVLKGLAFGALANDPALVAPPATVPQLLQEAAAITLAARENLIAMRADVGFAEQRIEEAAVRASGRRSALELAWNAAVLRDPYDAATQFQALETQMQTVFTLTARLSRLTLNDFLR